jgi:hypothetical protein
VVAIRVGYVILRSSLYVLLGVVPEAEDGLN